MDSWRCIKSLNLILKSRAGLNHNVSLDLRYQRELEKQEFIEEMSIKADPKEQR